MKNVLALIYTPTFGGPHNQILQMYDSLKEMGYNTIAVLPKGDPHGANILRQAGVEVVELNLFRIRRLSLIGANVKYLLYFVPNILSIVKVIKKHNIDIIQICGLMHVHGAFAAKLTNKKIVWQLLGTFAPKVLRFLISPIVALFADAVMVTGMRTLKKHPFNKYFRHAVTFAPPVNCKKFEFSIEKKLKAKEILGVSDQKFVVGTVGNQNKTKSHEKFVEIASKLTKENPDVCFRIVGNQTPSHASYYEHEVIKQAESKGLFKDGLLRIMEYKGSPADILSGFDVFLLTSYTEGIPTVILEAMANGRPIVSSNIGGVPEIVIPHETGYLYDFDDTDLAKKYLERLFLDADLRNHIGNNNASTALKKYDQEVCAAQHANIFNEALN